MILIRALAARPRLLGAVGAGAAAAVLLGLEPGLRLPVSKAIIAWDVGGLWFVVAVLLSMRGKSVEALRRQAAAQDEGRHLILALVLVAVAACLGAIMAEMSQARAGAALERAFRVGLTIATVALSWFLVQLVFALHYAHEYYADGEAGKPRGGLAFPGGGDPDYWDFLHFSVVIGVACQTADIAFTSRTLRRVGSLHGVVAFVFNTVLLALTVNLLAGLIGS